MKINIGDPIVCIQSHFAFAIDMGTGSVSVNDFLDIEQNTTGVYKGTIPRPEGINASGEMAQQFSAISKKEYEVVEVMGKTYATDLDRWDVYIMSSIIDEDYNKMLAEFKNGDFTNNVTKESSKPKPASKSITKEKFVSTFEDGFRKKYEMLKRYLGMMGINEEDAKEAVRKEEVTKIAAKYLDINSHDDCAEPVKLIFNIIDNIDEFMKDIENLN